MVPRLFRVHGRKLSDFFNPLEVAGELHAQTAPIHPPGDLRTPYYPVPASNSTPQPNISPIGSLGPYYPNTGCDAGVTPGQSYMYSSGSNWTEPAARPSDSPGVRATSKDEEGIFSFLGKITGTNSSTPPPSFGRSPPTHLPYNAFPPTYLAANGKTLEKGFPLAPPSSAVQPHPFVTHDVKEEDWTTFLESIRKGAALTIRQHIIAGVTPMMFTLGIAGGRFLIDFVTDNPLKVVYVRLFGALFNQEKDEEEES